MLCRYIGMASVVLTIIYLDTKLLQSKPVRYVLDVMLFQILDFEMLHCRLLAIFTK